jgi:hypothetical protein
VVNGQGNRIMELRRHEFGVCRTRANTVASIKGVLGGSVGLLFIMAFLLALANFEAVLGLYSKDRFGLGPESVGMLMGLIGMLSVIQQGMMIGPRQAPTHPSANSD